VGLKPSSGGATMSRRVDEDAIVASLNHQMNVLTPEHLGRGVDGLKLLDDISV
jgi:hypothetical protein